jgi:hypothetical protein
MKAMDCVLNSTSSCVEGACTTVVFHLSIKNSKIEEIRFTKAKYMLCFIYKTVHMFCCYLNIVCRKDLYFITVSINHLVCLDSRYQNTDYGLTVV